jgi:hypothetical protein
MDIDVYCDEAYPDLFSSQKAQGKYLVIGSLWLPSQFRDEYKKAIHELRDRFRVGGEFKWTKVTPSRLDFYLALISWFCEKGPDLRFRCIAVDSTQVDLLRFHENDQELGFYKFYYQLLHRWIYDLNTYSIFCDYKSNRRRDRLHVLATCLKRSNLSARIVNVQSVRSYESVLLQVADVLVGLAAAKMNKCIRGSSAKQGLLNHLEEKLGHKVLPTASSEKKFNVFRINLQGGW